MNIFFSYICLSRRFLFYREVNEIKFEMDKFTDLLSYTIEYEKILFLFLINMLIYSINIVDVIAKTSKEFEFIGKAIYRVN